MILEGKISWVNSLHLDQQHMLHFLSFVCLSGWDLPNKGALVVYRPMMQEFLNIE
jgi:hypothetical protein